MAVVFALIAYLMWGLAPLYWKQLEGVPALELIAHRVLWSFVLALGLIRLRGRWRAFGATFRDLEALRLHGLAAALLGVNWLAFVWAVLHDRIVDASLGYFMCPLVSVVLATCLLKERLSPLQWAAVGLAAGGVGFLVWRAGSVPVPALAVALTWSGYGLLKKRTRLGSVAGLGVETALLAPVAFAFLAWRAGTGNLGGELDRDGWSRLFWLLSTGAFTLTPLLLFAEAARSIRLTTLGLFQYFVPTGTFLLAVVHYREPFTWEQLVTFGAIWMSLGLYAVDRWRRREMMRPKIL